MSLCNNPALRGWSFTEEEIGLALSGVAMLNPSLDLTNACNLNCAYCFIEEKNSTRKVRLKSELSLDETFRVVDDFVNAGARTINIVGAGEPTIDPHLKELIEYVSARGLWLVLFTNGLKIAEDDSLLDLITRSKVSVVLKFNCGSKRRQDLLVGRRGHASRRDQALRRLLDAGFTDCYPTRLGLDTVAVQGNRFSLPRLHRWCRLNNIWPIIADYIPSGRTLGGTAAGSIVVERLLDPERELLEALLEPLNADERVALQRRLLENDLSYGIIRGERAAYLGGGSCTQLLGVYVDILGRIWPCVARTRLDLQGAQEPLGEIRKGVLPSDVWRRSAAMTQIRIRYDGTCPYKAPLKTKAELVSLPQRRQDA